MTETIRLRTEVRLSGVTPQALAWDGNKLWLSSSDLGFYKIDIDE